MTVNEPRESGWTVSDIEAEASNWTLSSDVQMLAFMETFSENLMSKLNTTSRALEELVCFTGEVSTKVNNTFNDFNMLSNIQFIESRVYEDDETKGEDSQQLPEVKEEDTSEVIGARIRASVEYGLTVLDAAYDFPQRGDDEDELDMVIEAKDPYSHRQLPYLIGSNEYCVDESAGITLLYQSDEESSKSEEDEDESTSEEEEEEDASVEVESVNEEDVSDTVSSTLPSHGSTLPSDAPAHRPATRTASIFDEPSKTSRAKVFDSIFDSTDESESEPEPDLKPDVKPALKPELTSKDGRSPSVSSVKSNKNPKGVPRGGVSIFGGRTVFEDGAIKVLESEEEEETAPEPAPQEKKKKALPPRASRGIFSSSEESGESDDETVPAVNEKKANRIKEVSQIKKNDSLFDSSSPSPEPTEKQTAKPTNKKAATFDSIFGSDSEDDDIFSGKKSTKSKKAVKKQSPKNIQEEKVSQPQVVSRAHTGLFSDSEEDSTFSEPPPPKKQEVVKKEVKNEVKKEVKKEVAAVPDNLFDSSDDDSNDLFGFNSAKKTTAQKIEQKAEPVKVEPKVEPKEEPTKIKSTNEILKKSLPSRGLFDSDSDEDDMFSSANTKDKKAETPKDKAKEPQNIESSAKKNLVKEAISKPSKNDPLFDESDDDGLFGNSQDPVKTSTPKQAPTNKKDAAQPATKRGLFESSDDDDSDTFGINKASSNKVEPVVAAPKEATVEVVKQETGLFNNSASDDGLVGISQKEVEVKNKSAESAEKSSSAKSKGLFSFDDSDSDDMFATPKQRNPLTDTKKQPSAEIPVQGFQRKPSKLDDLFGDSEEETDGNDVFSIPSEYVASKSSTNKDSLFEESSLPSEKPSKERAPDWDAKTVPTKEATVTKRKSSKLDDLFGDSDEEDNDIFSVTPSSAVSKRTSSNKDTLSEEKPSPDKSSSSDTKSKTPPKSNIAKLQNNLNLSPAMLMGGARPVRKKKTSEEDKTHDVSKPEEAVQAAIGGHHAADQTSKSESPAGDDKVLVSVTKSRPKRGGRRPPTRGKPAQATTPSTTGVTPSTTGVTPSTTTAAPKAASMPEPPQSSKVPSVPEVGVVPAAREVGAGRDTLFEEEEEDIFGEISKPSSKFDRDRLFDDIFDDKPTQAHSDDLFKTPSPEIEKSKTSSGKSRDSLFDFDEDALFSAAKQFPPASSGKEKAAKISPDLGDEDLFSGNQPSSSTVTEKKKKIPKKKKADLFDDDFDLFSDATPAARGTKKEKKKTKSTPKKVSDFDDPLFG